jgi:ATP phosphoribosyltransferase regulatory subunit
LATDRAYLAGGRVGPARAALGALCARIMARFEAAGCARVDAAALHPADTLLDVYGEDLRARAFTLTEPGGRELCLRPDFTVPVMQLHLAARAEPARYCYLGPVWRRQPPGSERPVEYLQAGVEIYGETPAEADAESFALVHGALAEAGVAAQAVTGDLGVILALLDDTPMPAHRRAALKRHLWRPARFHALLDRYAAPSPAPSPARAALLADPEAALAAAGPWVGARAPEEALARARALAEDAAAAPIPAERAALIDAALAVDAPMAQAAARLADLARAAGARLGPALDRLAARGEALARRGIDAGALRFRAATARSLEYYDGFVFELSAPGRPDLPPLAGGGRYDAVARGLGGEGAVGAIVRPEALMAASPC